MCGSTRRGRATRVLSHRLGTRPSRRAHTVDPDNTGGHLMQHGAVDLVIVGTDRVTRAGRRLQQDRDLSQALAAHDNGVPFYVRAALAAIDFSVTEGLTEIPSSNAGPRRFR